MSHILSPLKEYDVIITIPAQCHWQGLLDGWNCLVENKTDQDQTLVREASGVIGLEDRKKFAIVSFGYAPLHYRIILKEDA